MLIPKKEKEKNKEIFRFRLNNKRGEKKKKEKKEQTFRFRAMI